jgi:hypothetical protein
VAGRARVGDARYDHDFSPAQGTMDMAMDGIDDDIRGAAMQSGKTELDPGESAGGDAGSMTFLGSSIAMDAVFGDDK